MSLPRFSLSHRHAVFALLIGIIYLGIQARLSLPVQLFPDTDPPVVTVITPYPGVSSRDVAKSLSKLLEEEFSGLDGARRVTSTSQTGLSVVKVEFGYSRPVNEGAVDVQNAINRIRGQLPDQITEPQVMQFSSSDKPVITVALGSESLPLPEVRRLADNALRDRLQRIEGVAAVDVFGGHRRELAVTVHRNRLQHYNLSMDDVARVLNGWNLSDSGGRVVRGEQETVVRFDQPLLAPAQVKNLVVSERNGRYVYLGDLAEVDIELERPDSAYRYNGQQAIALQVIKRDDANTVSVVKKVRQELSSLQQTFPDLAFTVADDDAEFTELVIENMNGSVLTAIALVILVVLAFLGDLRQSAVIAVSIPVSFMLTFTMMQAAGIELNMVTMSAIILAIGLLVDDGIVVLENVHRHRALGRKSPLDAAISGTEEIFLADLAGTLTTMAVLVPLMFLGGFVGRLFSPLAWTLVFALGSSFIVSVTLIPLLSALWLSENETPGSLSLLLRPFEKSLNWLLNIYLHLLELALKHPMRTLAMALVLLLVSARLMAVIGSEMLPKFDAGNFQVMLDTPPGTRMETTLATVAEVERLLLEEDGVIRISTQIGYETGARYLGSRGAMATNQAELTVNLLPRTTRDDDIWTIMSRVESRLQKLPGVTLAILKEKGGTAISTTRAPIDIRLSGPHLQRLQKLGEEVMAILRDEPGVRAPYFNWRIDNPELNLTLDPLRTQALGVDGKTVARTAFEATDGRMVGPWRQAHERDLNVTLRYTDIDRHHLEDLGNVLVHGPRGSAPLRELADLQLATGPRIVTRENNQPTLDLLAYHQGQPLSDVIEALRPRLERIPLPAGYELTIGGEQRDFADARQRMLKALVGGLLAVYLILIIQFRSFKHPLTIMMAVPLQFTGVALALLFTGKYLSMPALLGIILLVGTVVNNSIVLIDYILLQRRQGESLEAAIRQAVRVRFRPIMMTALSDVAGMLPLAMELAVGTERFSPIATAVIGGILAATLLTLVIVPTIFLVLDQNKDNEREPESPSRLEYDWN